MEELVEVYSSVKDIEQSLLKACNIGKFIIGKNKEMFQANIELQEELEEVDLERQTLEEQIVIQSDEIKQLKQEIRALTA